MQYHGSETFTVKSPILPFLDHATLQESTGRIFWNTITLHRLLVEDGMYSHKEGRWFQRVQKIAADHCIAPDDCIPRPTGAERSGCVDCYLIGTASLIAWMTTQCTANQAKPAIKDMCSKWLAAITEKALLSHSRLAVTAAAIIVGPHNVIITRGGDIRGWGDVIAACCGAVQTSWGDAAAQPIFTYARLFTMLQFAIEATVAPFSDTESRTIMRSFVLALLTSFLNVNFEKWVTEIYAAEERIDRLPVLHRCRERIQSAIDPG